MIPVKTGDIFPDANAEGWGDFKQVPKLSPSCHTSSIGNCGLTVVQNISCYITLDKLSIPKVVPEAIRGKYLGPWGEARKEWEVPYQKFRESLEELYQDKMFEAVAKYIKSLGDYNCFILSDGVNKHNPVRLGTVKPHQVNTAWFGRKLVEKRYGYVIQSPLSVNAVHCAPTDFGYTRVWIWYPPNSLAFKPDKYLGYGKILTREELVEKVQNHGNFLDKNLSKEVIGEKYIDSYKL